MFTGRSSARCWPELAPLQTEVPLPSLDRRQAGCCHARTHDHHVPMLALLKLVRVPSLKTVAEFRSHVASLGLDLPCEDVIITGSASSLTRPVADININGTTIG